MSKYFKPLWVFLGGNLLLLILWLLLPAIGGAGDALAAATAEHADTFWGWGWASNSTRLLVVLIGELLVIYGTFRAFLSTRD